MKLLKLLPLCLILLISGCGQSTREDVFEKIENRYKEMPNYALAGEMAVYSNKATNKYSFIEIHKIPDTYLLSYEEGLKILFEGENVTISRKGENNQIETRKNKEGYMYFFIDKFFEGFLQSQITEENFSESGNYIYMKCKFEERSGEVLTEELYLDKKRLTPKKMILYNSENDKIFEIIYTNFEFVSKFKENAFSK